MEKLSREPKPIILYKEQQSFFVFHLFDLKKGKKFKVGLNFNGLFNNDKNTKKEDIKTKIINWVIFCQFIKEFISFISHKFKFEKLIENVFTFYSDRLDEYNAGNINNEEEEEEEEEEVNEDSEKENNIISEKE